MESKTAKKKFCCASHRLNYHRELKRGTLIIEDKNLESFVEKNKNAYDANEDQEIISDEVAIFHTKWKDPKIKNVVPEKVEKSKVMEEMERRVAEIQKQLLNKK